MNDELNILINDLISKKGGTRKDYRLLMDKIGFHESRLDPRAQQIGGGPGRGKYQFEEGRYKGGKTAANRASRYYKSNNKPIPRWLKNLEKQKSVDASKLSDKQQDILFLTNMLGHPKADLGKVIKGEQPVEDFWANYHWGGNKKDRDARIASFNKSITAYDEMQPVEQSRAIEPVNSIRGLGLFNPVQPDIMSPGVNTNEFANGGIIDPPNNGRPDPVIPTFNISDYTGPKTYTPTTPGATPESTVGKAFVEDWFKNPITQQRLQRNIDELNTQYGGNVRDTAEQLIDEGLARTQGTKYDINLDDSVVGAQYKPYTNIIEYYKTPTSRLSAHEHSHALGIDNLLSGYINKKFGSPAVNAMRKWGTEGDLRRGIRENIGRLNVEGNVDYLRYLGNESEIYPHLMEMREHLKVKPGEIIDDSHIEKLMKDKKQKRLFKYYDPSTIKNILNTVALNEVTPDSNRYNDIG